MPQGDLAGFSTESTEENVTPHFRTELLLGFCFALAAPRLVSSQVVSVDTRHELVMAVADAEPGTTILIAPGEYDGGLDFRGLRGEEGKPIILAAVDKNDPPVFRGRNSCLHLTDPVFVELHDLIFREARGNGINVDDGGTYDSPAHHVVLRNLTIRDVGPSGNRDAIKLSGVNHFRVEGCTIERWGDSGSGIDMVGCHDGLITECTFRYRSDLAANGVQTKGGSRDVAIRRCRFEHAGGRSVNIGGSTGRRFLRPQGVKYEAKAITVEDCTFIGSSAPVCFVGVDEAVVRYNTIYRPTRYVLRVLQESRDQQFVPCRNGVFANNVIAFRSDEVRGIANVGTGTAPETFGFSGNFWYCIDRPQRSDRLALPVRETGGTYGSDPRFSNADQGDLSFAAMSPVRDAGVRVRHDVQ